MKSIQLILLFLLLVISTSVYGYKQHYTGRVTAGDISGGLLVEDQQYDDMQNLPGWDTDYYNASAKGLVQIGVDHLWNGYVSQSYDLEYLMDIKWYDEDGNDHLIQNVCMRIGYDPSALTNYEDQATYLIDGAHKIEVIFKELREYNSSSPCSGTIVSTHPDNLYLEGVISVERYYLGFNEIAVWTNSIGSTLLDEDGDTKNDFIELNWGYVEGAELYDVEWTHVNDYKDNGDPKLLSEILFTERDFSLNSTRISTTDQTYKIPMIFNRGYVVYRVRALAKGGPLNGGDPTFGHWVFGKWSTDGNMLGSTQTLSDFPDIVQITATDAHDEDKNWQHVATYAEDGKRKDVVTYYDGSMRNRQMVTRINSDDHVVVGQTVYDYQGREALQILPVPLHESTIKYREQFNKTIQGTELTKDAFDLDNQDPCEPQVLQLSLQDGAGKYYSSNNPNQEDWQAYVPDANGYAYTQIEYTPDNTGRVRRQSGVGEDHMLEGFNVFQQINIGGHESKYFYGQPAQEELDILFGANVGYNRHYKKNMVVDANGQVSVSYMDAHGRVIATSLAGDGITGLENLKDENDVDQTTLNAQTITANLLGSGTYTNNYVNADNTTISYDGEILVSTEGINNFVYTVDIPPYSDPCLSADLPVVVDLEIGLENNCGDELFVSGAGLTEVALTGNPTLSQTRDLTDGLTADLSVGNYSVRKYLTVNEEALEAYAEQYIGLLDPQCLYELNDFISYQDVLLNDLVDCSVTCEECVSALESYITSEYGAVPENETDPGYDIYIAAYDDCMLSCKGKSYCETMKEMMLNDVSPNGQYGEYDLSNYSTTNYPLSVFNTTNNLLPSSLDYRDLQYFESDGSQSLIYIDPSLSTPLSFTGTPININGDQYVEPQQLNDLEDFIANWSPSWAQSLIVLHPEYCYLSFCDDLSTPNYPIGTEDVSSEEFDEILLSTTTFNDAASITINGTICNLTDLYDPGSTSSPVRYDPYFNGVASPASVSLMVAKLTNYANSLSMTNFAAFTADCATFYNGTGTCSYTYNGNDEAWNNYKSFYISAKQEIQQIEREEYAIANGCFNGCIGSETNAFAFTPGFWNGFSGFIPTSGFFDWGTPIDLCSFSNFQLYKDKDARFPSPTAAFNLSGDNQQDVENTGTQTDYEYYELTGLCPNAVDIQNFLLTLAMDDNLTTSGVPIADYGAFTQDLYEILKTEDGHLLTDYYPYKTESDISVSGDVLTIGFKVDGYPQSSCDEITLTIPGTTTLDWNTYLNTWSIAYMGNMNVTGTNTFTIEATTDDGTSIILAGNTDCFDLTNCSLEFDNWLSEQCQPNVVAQELAFLMSSLIAAGELDETSPVNISQVPFINFIQNIDGMYGGTWTWVKTFTGYYILTNGTTGFIISVQGGGFSPTFITSIMPNPQPSSDGVIHWIDNSGSPQSNLVNITSNGSPVSLGECGVIESYTCSEAPQKRREALHDLLADVFAENIQNTDVLNYHGMFSNHLQPQLGSSMYALSGINLSLSSNTISVYDLNNISGPALCQIELEIINNYSSATLDDVTIEGLYVLEDPINLDASGNAYNFIIHAKNSLLDDIIIEGSSCFSLANCNNCDECGVPLNFLQIANNHEYHKYETTLNSLNLQDSIVPREVFVRHSYNQSQFKSYMKYVKSINENGLGGRKFVNIDSYSRNAPCWVSYENYLFNVGANAANNPSSIYYLTFDEFLTYHVLCLKEYISYHQNGGAGLLTIDEFCGNIAAIPICKPYTTGPFDIPEPDDIDECQYFLDSLIDYQANHDYEIYKEGLINSFIEDYKAHIMNNATETFTREYLHNEYQYTLYYYDQAGNLVQTVPPKGVDFVATGDLSLVVAERDNDTKTTLPGHTYKTQYHYNSLNQLIEQTTPDTDGPSEFFYDALGRLVVSQNAKQENYSYEAYSYTLYDELGRVVEVGQISDVTAMNQTIAGDTGPFDVGHDLYDWLNNGYIDTLPTKKEVTQTHYDMSLPDPSIQVAFGSTEVPSNWRNRIASITYQRDFDWNENVYDNALHYRYDIHGNVSQLLQEVDALTNVGRQFVRTDYSYDLISGNVATVAYQTNKTDAFYHSYWYDADNRITHAFTSTDRVHWDRDAKYFYYEHGPLARTEIGHNKVQANDYAYTIQGWIKGVNSATLYTDRDQGRDADMTAYGNLNRFVAKDEVGYTLGYFEGDYASIGGHSTTEQFEIDYSANTNFTSRNLYNGNITHMVTTIHSLVQSKKGLLPHAMVYDYDQLNRIKSAQSFTHVDILDNIWNSGSLSSEYATSYKYDLNGNLHELTRNGYTDLQIGGMPLEMDHLTYEYWAGTNQLSRIIDSEDPNNDYTTAIKNNGTSGWFYTYDEIGQLVSDDHSEIDLIEWTVNNKVHKITRDNGSIQPDMEFVYGPLGNRIAKIVKPRPGGTPSTQDEWEYTYYERDAQGNTMATYKLDDEGLKLTENTIYGSSRLGTLNRDVSIPLFEVGCPIVIADPVGPLDPVDPVVPWPVPVGNVFTKGYVVIEDDPGSVVISVGGAPLNTSMKGSDYPDVLTFAKFLVNSINSNSYTTGWLARSLTNDPDSVILEIRETIPEGKSLSLAYMLGGISQPGNVIDVGLPSCNKLYSHTLGNKNYELSNHLGNVLTTVSDKKISEELTNVVLMDDTFDAAGDQLDWTLDDGLPVPVSLPSGNYDVDVSGGTITLTGDEWDNLHKNLSFEEDKNYTIEFDVESIQGLLLFAVQDGGLNNLVSGQLISSVGSYTYSFTGSAFSSTNVYFVAWAASTIVELDNIVITSDEEIIYTADVTSYSDYYPGGMIMPGRSGSANSYKYGFNGMEKDDEIKGSANSHDFGARMYDPRIVRWLSRDPKEAKYPHQSTYAFANNSPIMFMDPNGEEGIVSVTKNESGGGTITISANFKVVGGNMSDEEFKNYTDGIKSQIKNGTYEDVEGNCWDVVFDLHFEPYNGDEPVENISLEAGENILELNSSGGREHTNGGTSKIGTKPMGSSDSEIEWKHSSSTGNHAKLGSTDDKSDATHEMLHLLGLQDRYSDRIFGGRRISVADEGWPSDPMSTPAGEQDLNQTHYDNYGRVFSKLGVGTYLLNHYVDFNVETGGTVGENQDGLTDEEKASSSEKPTKL